jgi:cell division septal protein FtsQ
MKMKGRILSILIFTALMLSVVYLSIVTSNGVKNKIDTIEVTGNNFLSANEYLKFTQLDNKSNYKFLSLHLIKDRFEKHPFIEKAEVKFESRNEVRVNLIEKKFEGIIVKDSSHFLITENFELVPVISPVKNLDVPVITNPVFNISLTGFIKLKDDDTETAFKIIETAKIVDAGLYSHLSEVNLRDGKDIILTFKNFDFPVILGRGNEIKKIIFLNKILNKIRNNTSAKLMIDYMDLRFDKLIYIGTAGLFNAEKGV